MLSITLEGLKTVKNGPVMLGDINPKDSVFETIRVDFLYFKSSANICCGSDAVVFVEKEVALWFTKGMNLLTGAPLTCLASTNQCSGYNSGRKNQRNEELDVIQDDNDDAMVVLQACLNYSDVETIGVDDFIFF
ncbi:ndk [Lepeophtheirus salmonis]|uniref:Ndk n=1 Tax=Lepeophtheirus salmonis TaxID=72036 RepID=A0A7R8CHK4_LEPSM|nr:ndk [Lepeophtheirus salmonis]CAF2792018.1 ndk [Lepeophtheirus salmonis]